VKTEPFRGATANLTVFNTDIRDFQAQVVNADVGVLRGYLANAERVRVRGFEIDGSARAGRVLSVYASYAFTDGKYVSFTDAPPPLEDTGGPVVKDISGSILPGISKHSLSFGGEHASVATFLRAGRPVLRGVRREPPFVVLLECNGIQVSRRRGILPGECTGRLSCLGWVDPLSMGSQPPQRGLFRPVVGGSGNTGLYVGQPGDARTAGVTLRISLRK
jgi:iron complex outermembrane receptor protein